MLIPVFAVASLSAPAEATLFLCQGTVASVSNVYAGTIKIRLKDVTEEFTMCSFNSVLGGVPPEACRLYYTGALSALALGKNIRLFFDTDNPTNAGMAVSCVPENFREHMTRVPYLVTLMN